MPLVSSRSKCWLLGEKYAVNLRWPAAAAELQRLSTLSCKSLITLWEGHFKNSLICLGKRESPVAACHLLANWAFCWLLEWSFLVDTGVLSQHVWEACQSPGSHWKLSAATVPPGNLVFSYFCPSFVTLHFSGTLPSIECFHLEEVVLLCAKARPDPAARFVTMPVGLEIVMMLAFSGALTCFFPIKMMIR